LLEVITWHCC